LRNSVFRHKKPLPWFFWQPFKACWKIIIYTTSHLYHLKRKKWLGGWRVIHQANKENKMCKYVGLPWNLGLETGPFRLYSWASFWKGFHFLKNLNLNKIKKHYTSIQIISFILCRDEKNFCYLTFFLKKKCWFLFSLFYVELFWFYNQCREFDWLT